MKRRELLVLPLLLLCPDVTLAAAGEITVNWDAPTEYTDGTPLPQSEIRNFRIQVGQPNAKGGFGTLLITQWVGPTKRSYTFVALPPGKYSFRGYCVTTNNATSAPTKTVLGWVK
jgi:hypothetical protein